MYLGKAGLNKGALYAIGIILSGGGYIEHSHTDGASAMHAQLAEQATAIALLQQSNTFLDKKLDQLDRDLRNLTHALDPTSKTAIAYRK